MLSLLLPILSWLGPLGSILVVLVTLLGSAGAGAYGMHRFDNASEYYHEKVALEHRLKTIQDAQQEDAKAAAQANKRADELQGKFDGLNKTITDGACFTSSESDSMRNVVFGTKPLRGQGGHFHLPTHRQTGRNTERR